MTRACASGQVMTVVTSQPGWFCGETVMLIFPNWMNHDEPLAGEDVLLIVLCVFYIFPVLGQQIQVMVLDARP